MEIVKKKIRMSRQRSQAMNQITLEEDLNVPDSKADVTGIIQHRAKVRVEESKIMENQILVSGNLEVWMLCLAEGEQHPVYRLQAKLPFSEKLNLEGAKPGDNVSLKWKTEDIRISLINSRKISIQALVTFEASVEELYDTQAAVEVKEMPDVSVRTKKIEPLSMAVQKKDIFRIKEEISLSSNKPNIGEILWDSVQLRSWDVRPGDGVLDIRGELFVFVLYAADDENGSRQWIESALPFQGQIDCTGCRPEMVPDIEVTLAERKVDEIAKTEQGIKMEGAIEISVLYITADDEHPFALVTGMIPFSHLMEAEGITSECRFHLHPQIEQLSASMSGEEVEIKGTLSLNLFAVRIMHQNCILDIEEKELDLKKLQERPGIVCYVVQPEDTLWDIAKKYYTTSEHIRNMNHLTEEIRAGQKLLIVKSAVLHTAS